ELTLLTDLGEVIAAELGLGYGDGIWACLRMGFPAAVFSDTHRLSDANILSHFFHLQRAVERGFRAYDLGLAEARPGSGLLELNARRGATIFAPRSWPRLSVRVARRDRAKVLAHSPLFSLERGALWLNVGIVRDDTDQQIATRYGSFSFRGLKGVRLHSERAL